MSGFTEFQQQAIGADGNVLVSAGAGTGKTRTVVQRCLRLLLEEKQSIESILMVTFTEAAAAEMRARLRKELEEARNAELETWNSTEGSSAFRIPHSALEEQLALLDSAHISTLHGFCLQLIREHFHELGIDPQVAVMDETQTQPLIHATLDDVFERCYERLAPYADAALALIRDYGGGSEEKICGLILQLHRYVQTLPQPEQWLRSEANRLGAQDAPDWPALFVTAFNEWRAEWLTEIRQYTETVNVQVCVKALESCPDHPTQTAAAEVVRAVVEAGSGEWVRGTKGKFHDPIEKFFIEGAFLHSTVAPDGVPEVLREDWSRMRQPMLALLELTRAFTVEFTRAKRALGGVDFADLEQLALACLLDEHGAPTETARLWQGRFTHVFVDECQDINAAQEAIIRAVSRGARAGEPSPDTANRFLVGDVKQSIYRFRLADPTIFRACEEAWRSAQGGRRIPLADNFRSREAILNFVNPLFATLMRESIGGVRYDADAQLRFGDPVGRAVLGMAEDKTRRVELHVIHRGESSGEITAVEPGTEEIGEAGVRAAEVVDLGSVEAEARLIATRLRELRQAGHEIWDVDQRQLRPVEWRDMVVLLRSPGPRVEAFAKEFARGGVPLSAARAGFFSALEVLDLINLLRLLNNPLQDIPLVAVLRSPLFGFSADELAAIRIEAGREGEFFAALNRFRIKPVQADGSGFVSALWEKVRRFRESFERWRSLARHTSLSQCLEAALTDTGYEAQLLAGERGRERAANVQRLLELARNYDPFQRQGLYRFLRFVDEQQDAGLDQEVAAAETGNAVRLMSIHRSKGLEFPVVVVGCLAAPFNQRDLSQDILLSPSFGLCARILCPESQRRYPSLPWWLARRREQRELLGEEMRLLYVAMTRARDTLLLTAHDGNKNGASPWPSRMAEPVADRELVSARGYWDWLRLWLGTVTQACNWTSEAAGANSLLSWSLQPASELAPAPMAFETQATPLDGEAESLDIEGLRARLSWRNPWPAATTETAKTHVTALRRRSAEDDTEARALFRRPRAPVAGLSAAEVGSAHHTFLQQVKLDRAGSLVELRNEAERMVGEGHLSRGEADSLDFAAFLRFWLSAPGRRIVQARIRVHRELPFTARFTPEVLQALGVPAATAAPDDFIVVQGVIDLAVIHEDAIWLIDFKTDVFQPGDLEEKVREYSPQVRLYAMALAGIYRRPVTEAALHFLSTGETSPISVNRF